MEKDALMKNRRWPRLIASVAVVLLALNLTLGGHAWSADGVARSVMPERIAGATTRADHEALADAYEQEAKALDAKAAEHEALAKAYAELGYLRDKPGLIAHCASLVDRYRAAAQETRELARAHQELAARAAQK